MKFGLLSCALLLAYTIGSILQYRNVDLSQMELSRTFLGDNPTHHPILAPVLLLHDLVSVVMTLLLVHQFVRSPFQNKEAHKSVGMVFLADIFPLEVLSGFIVMFCRIWTQPSSKGHRDVNMEEYVILFPPEQAAVECPICHKRLVYSDHGDFAQLLVVAVNGWHVGSGYAPPTLLVAKGLRQRLVYSDHGDFAQLLVVAVNGWHVGSGYAPPTHHGIPQSELCSLLSDWCCLRAGQTQKWILATDANETPDNSEILTHCAAMGAYAKLVNRPTRWKGNREIDFLVTNDPESLAETLTHCAAMGAYAKLVNRPTRWKGNREIDFLVTNDPESLAETKCLEIKLSDHVPLSTKVRCCSHETLRGSLQSTPCFDKPVGVSSELWRDLISQHWNNHHMLSSLHEVISRESVCPDAEWTSFQEILNDCFRLALNSLASHPDAEVREDALKCLRRNSAKGHLAKFAGLNWDKRGPELDTSSFVLRRLRKNLARACELSRLLRLGAAASSSEVQTLRRRTGLTEEDQQAVEESIARWSSEVDKLT
eukprot:s5495_g4.t1